MKLLKYLGQAIIATSSGFVIGAILYWVGLWVIFGYIPNQ